MRYTIEGTRAAADRARQDAETAAVTSEYPRYGRSVHEDKAAALEALGDTLAEMGERPPAPTGDAYADRRARRVWALRMRAAIKCVESASLRARSHDMGAHRPLGQPLVGSPARRAAQARAIERERRVDDRAHHAYQEAEELERRARAAEQNRAISSDDSEALEKLRAKLAQLEAQRDRLKSAREDAQGPLLNYRAPDGVELRSPYHAENMRLGQVDLTREEYRRIPTDYKGTHTAADGSHRVRVAMQRGSGLAAVFLIDTKAHPKPDTAAGPRPDGPAAWALSNLAGRIRQVRERIAALEAVDRSAPDVNLFAGEGWRVVDSQAENRLRIYFDEKPPQDVRRRLRSVGFRWSPAEGAWQRQRGSGAERSARFALCGSWA